MLSLVTQWLRAERSLYIVLAFTHRRRWCYGQGVGKGGGSPRASGIVSPKAKEYTLDTSHSRGDTTNFYWFVS